MFNRIEPDGAIKQPSKSKYFRLTFNQLLTCLCAAAVPVAICVYTAVDSRHKSEQANANRQFDLQLAEKLRQQRTYDQFIQDIYLLNKDGQLNDSEKPWAFANARYWSANRQWYPETKVESLVFLKQKDLIGRQCWTNDDQVKKLEDIIRLNGLNFDHIHLKSQTNGLLLLNMKCVHFDQISLDGSSFQFVNLDGATFDGSRLHDAAFTDSSLVGAIFNGTKLLGTNFGNSNLRKTQFINVDLTATKLTEKQLQQAVYVNSKLPNGTETKGTIEKATEVLLMTTEEKNPITTNTIVQMSTMSTASKPAATNENLSAPMATTVPNATRSVPKTTTAAPPPLPNAASASATAATPNAASSASATAAPPNAASSASTTAATPNTASSAATPNAASVASATAATPNAASSASATAAPPNAASSASTTAATPNTASSAATPNAASSASATAAPPNATSSASATAATPKTASSASVTVITTPKTTIIATDEGGVIRQNTVWTKANSPYRMATDVQVPRDVTLTIEAGVQIIYTNLDDFEIFVKGFLQIKGTPEQHVIFDGSRATNNSKWTLKFEATNLSLSSITYTEFLGPKQSAGLFQTHGSTRVNTGELILEHCIFDNTQINIGSTSLFSSIYRISAALIIQNSTITNSVIANGQYDSQEIKLLHNQLQNVTINALASHTNINVGNCRGGNVTVWFRTRGPAYLEINDTKLTNMHVALRVGPSSHGSMVFIIRRSVLFNATILFNAGSTDECKLHIISSTLTIRRAIEIESGSLENSSITSFGNNTNSTGVHGGSIIIIKSSIFNFHVGLSIFEYKTPMGTITNSNFYNNSRYNIINWSQRDVNATGNWWGTKTNISDTLYDYWKNIKYGEIIHHNYALDRIEQEY